MLISYVIKMTLYENKIIFICTGNSCRSQIAEGLFREEAGDKFEVLVQEAILQDYIQLQLKLWLNGALTYKNKSLKKLINT